MATLAMTPTPNCSIDLNKFSAVLCATVQQIVLDRLDKAFEEKIDSTGETKLRNARAQFWLIAKKIREAVVEQCRQLAAEQQYNAMNGSESVVDNSSRSRGPSFVIGDDSSSTTSASPSIASSGVHSSACCSDEGVQVDLLPSAAATPGSALLQQRRDDASSSMVVVGSTSTTASGRRPPAAVNNDVLPPSSPSPPPPQQRHQQQQQHGVAGTTGRALTTTMSHDVLVLAELRQGMLKHRMLEQRCPPTKAVELRRRHLVDHHQMECIQLLPFEHYDYSEVKDACCENVVGFVPLPTGVAGPLYFDGALVHLPLATTEGALVASVSRGCLSINEAISMLGNNAFSVHVFRDGMSRAPVLEFPCVRDSIECFRWVQRSETFAQLKQIFEETSNYACLQRIDAHLEGTYLYLRFVASTGDAMGMNMVTKGTGRTLVLIKREFPQSTLVSISGNMCVDKKPSALNWIEGRGKSVVAEAIIPASIVERVLRTSVDKMVKLGQAKLLVGSCAAVTVGGWNAHAANVVAAMFLATGQDAAQVVSSSMCLTQLQHRRTDECGGGVSTALHITCTMNCLEVGTVGGGTMLTPQGACLEMLDCRRAGLRPGQNAERFARLVCAAVLAGELSLLASQCTEGDLEKSHLRLNRSSRSLALNLTAGGGSGRTAGGNSPQHHHIVSTPPAPPPYSSPFRQPLSSAGTVGSAMRGIPEHSPLLPHHQRLTPPANEEGILQHTERDAIALLTTATSTDYRRKDRQQQQQLQQRHHRQQQQQRRGLLTSSSATTMTTTTTATTTMTPTASSLLANSNTNSAGGGAGIVGTRSRKGGQMCEPL